MLHLFFERLQILGGKGLVAVDVIIETVCDGRADGVLGAGAHMLNRFGQNVRRGMAESPAAVLIGEGKHFHLVALMELLPQFLDLAVHADDERFLLQTGLLRRVKTLHSFFGDDFHFSSSFKGAKSPSPRGDGRYAVVPPCFIRSRSAKALPENEPCKRRNAALRLRSGGGLHLAPHARLAAGATLSGEQAGDYSSPSSRRIDAS